MTDTVLALLGWACLALLAWHLDRAERRNPDDRGAFDRSHRDIDDWG